MNMTDMRRKDVERRQRGFASMDPQRQREIAQVEHLMELARVYAHAYYNHYTGSVDGMLDKSKATLKAALEAHVSGVQENGNA